MLHKREITSIPLLRQSTRIMRQPHKVNPIRVLPPILRPMGRYFSWVGHEFGQAGGAALQRLGSRRAGERRVAVADVFTQTGLRIAAFLRERRARRAEHRTQRIRAAVQVVEEGQAPQPLMDQEANLMKHALNTDHMRWVAIGCDPARNHG